MASYEKAKVVRLSTNFDSTEFDCKGKGCCKATEVDPELVAILQKIRDHFKSAVTINSAYRCQQHNKKIGGASKSKHMYGQAADIKVKGVKPLKVAQYAESIGIKGIGLYPNFVHVDTRTSKFFWYGNEQDERNTFGKYDGLIEPETSSNAGEGKQLQVTGATVNIRKGPSANFDVVATAKRGQKYERVETGNWHPIVMDGNVYWISGTYTKEV